MNAFRFALTAITLSALIAGCGGATGSVPTAMTPNVARHATGTSGDLLYLYCCANPPEMIIATYPQGNIVSESPLDYNPYGICSNSRNGSVWIVSLASSAYEYAHGSATPMAQVTIPNHFLTECAVDPNTGDFAVCNGYGIPSFSVDVWHNTSTAPTIYSTSFVPNSVTYDDEDNIFVDGFDTNRNFVLAELRKGSTEFTPLTFDKPIAYPGDIFWDGTYVAMATSYEHKTKNRLYRFKVVGHVAQVHETIKYRDWGDTDDGAFQTYGDVFLSHTHQFIGLWHYPTRKGGKPYDEISITGVFTLSVAPTRK